ncbi:CRAL-TRIO domain-containing protein [Absidia repens]|uniref:CRAL-TRIO domain-containing protein n=1 Tax=Absidia repens TaxID=90262 RepID=A0A1X2J194_9FUNG|nr:CRAL-TRIO domain-containing protein [Absidia repens]
MVVARTEEEKKEAIAQLSSQLKGYPQVADEYLEQFLIARSWNVDGAFKQLVDTFAWRKENEIDMYPVATKENGLPVLYPIRGYSSIPDQNLTAQAGVAESVLRVYGNMGGSCLHKVDNDGCPIYIERLGYHQAKLIAKNTTAEEIFHYHVGCNEFLHRVIMKDCSKMAGKTINRETVIFDCTGMGWSQFHMPAINLIRTISDVDQKYYPETLNRLFLVNAPGAFVYVWKIVKGWLDPGTIDKIQILGSDYQSQLLEYISAENLPSFLGGSCTCDHLPGGCVPSQGIS